MRVWFCEGCGAPLDAPWAELVVECGWCGSQNMPGKPGGPVPPRVPADGRPRLNLGGRTYVLESRLAEGDSSRVYRGRWVVRLGELVVVKVLAALSDADLMRREWATLKALATSTANGAEHFVTRLPAPVAHGLIDTDRARTASAFGWRSGFVHSLADVVEAWPSGVSGPVGVWVLKRLLESLDFVHRSGFVHGAVVPEHVLVHPRDHGAMLVGFTLATPWSEGHTKRLPGVPRSWASWYDGREATPALDIAMACRCVQEVRGWALSDLVRSGPVARVVAKGRSGQVHDAWALRDALVSASREEFGPPAYHPLEMPGWRT